MSNERVIHDWLLEHKPEAASHQADSCKFCNDTDQEKDKVAEGDKIFTQEQHESLLASAIEKARSEATTKADAEVVSLNERVMAFEQEADAKDAEIAELKAVIAAREEQDRLNALASERASLVKAEANFSDEQIEARKAQWASMSEGDFKAYLEDMRVLASSYKGEKDKKPTADFDGTRQTAADRGEVDVIKDFFSVAPALVGKI